ncbi:MAG: ATP-binding protein [Bryobacteraceae bacterium]
MTVLRRSPFKVDHIEDDPNAFGLRPEAVRFCAEALFNRQSVLISGERGIGKSSLANQFKTIYSGTATLLERSNISVRFPRYLCGYTFCTSDTSLADVCASILFNLESQCLLLRSTTVKNTKVEFTLDLKVFKAQLQTEIVRQKPGVLAAEFVAALEVLHRSAALLGMEGINIIIDEVDELHPTVNFGRFIKAVHERLQQQGIAEVTFTLTGQRGVFERLFQEEQAIERIVRHVPITILSPEESRHILTFAADHAHPPFAIGTEAQELILALATGHPYAVHLLGNAAFGHMEDEERMKRDDVLRGIGDVLTSDKAEKYVLHLRDLTDPERLVLTSASLYASRQVPVYIPPDWVCNNLLGTLPADITVEQLLHGLTTKDYLVEGPQTQWYRFRDELFRVFLSQFVFAHREREEERLAERKQKLDLLIDRERQRGDMKRFLGDYRQSARQLYPDRPPMLEYTLEVLNVSDVAADWEWEHYERGDLLSFE